MSGVVFFKTNMLEVLKKFYLQEIECQLWMDQDDCLIFKNGNFLFGFCQRDKADIDGIITFFYDEKKEVDRFYVKLAEKADKAPRDNSKYSIYHFFSWDPEGRLLEFQYFYNLNDIT